MVVIVFIRVITIVTLSLFLYIIYIVKQKHESIVYTKSKTQKDRTGQVLAILFFYLRYLERNISTSDKEASSFKTRVTPESVIFLLRQMDKS